MSVPTRARPQLTGAGMIGRLGKAYLPDDGLVDAANVALLLGRPLLLTGAPGCGKTDFAWAAAWELAPPEERVEALPRAEGATPLEGHVRSDSLATDLLYRYDAVRRFGDAQHGDPEERARSHQPWRYIQLKALGQAIAEGRQRVVLIDEIDKAPRDFPNDLLRELDRLEFEIPEIPEGESGVPEGGRVALRRVMGCAPGLAPLVVITSNVERQLPEAFLRRCIFFHVPFPEDLDAILRAHVFALGGDEPYRADVLSVFHALRAVPQLDKQPATAELIDWARALTEAGTSDRRRERRRRLADLAARVRADEPVLAAGERLIRGVPAVGCLLKIREDLSLAEEHLAQ